jgi:hypothetical protein
MFTPEDDSDILKKASYAAYSEAVKAAYRTLADAIAGYLDEHRELYNNEALDVPHNFRPLKDYQRALRIQKLTLRLALKAAEPSEHDVTLPDHANGRRAASWGTLQDAPRSAP